MKRRESTVSLFITWLCSQRAGGDSFVQDVVYLYFYTFYIQGMFIFGYINLFVMPQDGSSVIKSSSLPTYVSRTTPSRVEVTVECPKV
jgi:hypothetical protein